MAFSWHCVCNPTALLLKQENGMKIARKLAWPSFLVRFMGHENQTPPNHHWEADTTKSPW